MPYSRYGVDRSPIQKGLIMEDKIVVDNMRLMAEIVKGGETYANLEAMSGLSVMTLWRISKTGRMRFDTARMLNTYVGKEVFRATHCVAMSTSPIDFEDAAAVAKWNEDHSLAEDYLWVLASILAERKWD